MRIVVDAMGSDNNPEPDVAGAVMAARKLQDTIILVGNGPSVESELAKYDTTGLALEIVHASQVITMEDKPSLVVREKKDSSMHVGLKLVKNGGAEAFVTVGNTGAALGVAMLRNTGLGRIPGIKRPALGVIFPTPERPMLIDNGANADCKPEYLLQFALMGSIYVEHILGIKNPRVGLLSNGEEEGKGNILIQETVPLLAGSDLNFIGSIEPKEFMHGAADVIVTDGFTGNIMMKTAEAVASYMSQMIRHYIKSGARTAVGGLLARPAFDRVKSHLDPDEVGGAPLLGVNGVVIIGHGRSGALAMMRAIEQARLVAEKKIVDAIAAGVGREGWN
ncbi:MAG: phosphate acyltransferase PlsX [Candidatus Promineifilaceae bacterium]|nr:phosphate acyltransferase PlsX [Candidatus Promineifilaceae bacterium]